jgi:Domain of unknown function (DUF4169)
MAEIVNLKLHRKRKERAVRDEQAVENRAKFGRSKAEKALSEREKDLAEKALDAHKRDT